MKKVIYFILILFMLSFSFYSCQNLNYFALLAGEGKVFIIDEKGSLIKSFDLGLKGKINLKEVKKDYASFNYFETDGFKSDIYLIKIKSGDLIKVTEKISGYFPYYPKFVGPSLLVFTQRDIKADRESLYLFNIEKRELTNLTEELNIEQTVPIFVDEKEKLVYLVKKSEDEKESLYSFNLNTKKFERVIPNFSSKVFNPIFSKDGKYILFFSFTENRGDLYLFNLKSGDLKNITKDLDFEISTNFLVLENRVFVKVNDLKSKGESKILIIDLNSQKKEFLDIKNFYDFYLFTIAKSDIFFMGKENINDSYQLYSTDFEAKNVKRISQKEEGIFNGQFDLSKDNQKLIYGVRDKEGKDNIIFFNLNKNRKINLTKDLKIKIDSFIFLY